MSDNVTTSTGPHLPPEQAIRTALRWAWDQEILSQQDAEAALDWLDSRPVAPEPDWSSAPEWAMWWACHSHALQSWFENKPEIDGHVWKAVSGTMLARDSSGVIVAIDIPIGIDWRTLIRQRPESDA